MLIVGSALKGYKIEATDGHLGTVKTFLFDDKTWKIRWLVIDTGFWLSGRQVLVAPSAIGTPDHERQHLPIALTKEQIEASPGIMQDQPVTMQMQRNLYDYYGWDPYWGPNFFGASSFAPYALGGAFAGVRVPEPGHEYGSESAAEAATIQYETDDGDPHLRSMTALRGYHIHATDGSIGHVENFLVDDVAWAIRYVIVDTSNWWVGAHVLIAPYAVKDIDWGDHQVHLSLSRDDVRSSPGWDPAAVIDRAYQEDLHRHYGWPGFGW